MGKKKSNQRRKKNKARNVSKNPDLKENQQKTQTASTDAAKRIYSSLEDSGNVAVSKNKITQPFDYAAALKGIGENITIYKSVKLPENVGTEAKEDVSSKNKNPTLHDFIEEELLDVFDSPQKSDHNKIHNRVILNSKQNGNKSVSDSMKGVKPKSNLYVNRPSTSFQDFKDKTVQEAQKKNSYENQCEYIPDKYTSRKVSSFSSKPLTGKYISTASNEYIRGSSANITQEANSDVANKKHIPDQNNSCTFSDYQPHYKYSNEKYLSKMQNSKVISNALAKSTQGKKNSLHVDFAASNEYIRESSANMIQDANSDVTKKKHIPDQNTSCTTFAYQPHYKYSNEKHLSEIQNSKVITNTLSKADQGKRNSLHVDSAASNEYIRGSSANITQEANSDVINKKHIPDQNTSCTTFAYQPHYKYSNEKHLSEIQNSKVITNAVAKANQGKSNSLHVDSAGTIQHFIGKSADITQKENTYVDTKKYKTGEDPYQQYKRSIVGYLETNNPKEISSAGIKDSFRNGKDFSSFTKPVVEHPNKIKQRIYSIVSAFRKDYNNFVVAYHNWRSVRKATLERLKILVKQLHDGQLQFNKTQKVCREIGLVSRVAKYVPSAIGLIGSVSAFLSDVASGITSTAQAVNVDSYLKRLEEIMKHDAGVTQKLYEAISQCSEKYQEIEEVMKKYQSLSLHSTANKIFKYLEVKQFLMEFNDAYENGDVHTMLNVVDDFLENSSQLKVLSKISDLIVTYINWNPAILEISKSAGRVVLGSKDSVKLRSHGSGTTKCISRVSNMMMIASDGMEIHRLKSVIENDSSQSKLEDKIQEAIVFLKSELKQVSVSITAISISPKCE